MRTVLNSVNIILKSIAWLIVSVLILMAAVGYMTVTSVVWSISPLAGMGLLIFGLAVIAMVAYS